MEEFILTKDQIQIIWMKGNIHGFKEAREMTMPDLKNNELNFNDYFDELRSQIRSVSLV